MDSCDAAGGTREDALPNRTMVSLQGATHELTDSCSAHASIKYRTSMSSSTALRRLLVHSSPILRDCIWTRDTLQKELFKQYRVA